MTDALPKHAALAAALYLTASTGLHAETAAPSTPPTNSDSLEEVVVQGVNLEDQVSPLQRKVTSVFGVELSVLDTPRAVTEINAAQIRDQSIVDVTDFVKIVSSAYTNDQFGGANVPFLRGQSAEVFQNGMLRTPRSDGQPLSFNSVEGFDIVKGPASVVYGPTGNVGGYVNLVTKRPDFTGQHETVSATYGEYGTRKTQLDVTGPMTDTLAYRVSYEYEHSGSYYRFGYTHSSDVYAAFGYRTTGSRSTSIRNSTARTTPRTLASTARRNSSSTVASITPAPASVHSRDRARIRVTSSRSST
jgi:catecholate siderophore receptor